MTYKSFTDTADGWGINIVVINEKEEFINYIKK